MEGLKEKIFAPVIDWAPYALISLGVLLVFWAASEILSRSILMIGGRARVHAAIVTLIARSAKAALIIFGIVIALGILGINLSALVAGLGLTGFALGFALKDVISNVLAGVLLIVYHPFQINDRINVSGFEGIVISIDLRYTTLENEGTRVLIPNSKLFTDPISIIK